MSAETIWSRIREKPFRPFRLNTSDGRTFNVEHPEKILISKHRVTIAIYDEASDPQVDLPSREVVISPLHVASLEDIPSPQAKVG